MLGRAQQYWRRMRFAQTRFPKMKGERNPDARADLSAEIRDRDDARGPRRGQSVADRLCIGAHFEKRLIGFGRDGTDRLDALRPFERRSECRPIENIGDGNRAAERFEFGRFASIAQHCADGQAALAQFARRRRPCISIGANYREHLFASVESRREEWRGLLRLSRPLGRPSAGSADETRSLAPR
jgi:hypothetical protein